MALIQFIDPLRRANATDHNGTTATAGEYEYVLITLEDGSEFRVDVSRDGKSIEIVNNGRRAKTRISIEARSSNWIDVFPVA